MMQKLLIIAGPTCIGKSGLAVEIAKEFNGEIISADSMQVYSGCDIGTAKISNEEMQGISHYLINAISPFEEFSVGEFKQQAEEKIKEVASKNKLPIIVGGTGLYIEALIRDFDFSCTQKNIEIRQKYLEFLEQNSNEELHNLLKIKNPDRAEQIEVNDTKRVIRALEIEENKVNQEGVQDSENKEYDYLFIVLNQEREILYSKINDRVEKMFDLGLEKEVRTLLDSGVTFSNQCMQSIGYKEWKEFFENGITKEQLKERIKQNTRRYAKRQITWFRHREGIVNFSVDEKTFKMSIKNKIKEWLKNNGQ